MVDDLKDIQDTLQQKVLAPLLELRQSEQLERYPDKTEAYVGTALGRASCHAQLVFFDLLEAIVLLQSEDDGLVDDLDDDLPPAEEIERRKKMVREEDELDTMPARKLSEVVPRPKKCIKPGRNVFDVTWNVMEQEGKCDGLGGAEYRRVYAQWVKANRPYRITDFIRDNV